MASTWEHIKLLFDHIVGPWVFMSKSAAHIPLTIRTLIHQGAYTTFLSPSAFSEALFGQFWATVGPNVKLNAEVVVIPLLEGRVKNAQIQDDPVHPPMEGVVIEVGAGTGQWADVFARLAGAIPDGEGLRRRKGGISKIYGIEPNPQSAGALRKRTAELGMKGIYEVVPVGIESLSDETAWEGRTLQPGSVDCIVSVLCLCSIPEPAENCRRLYELLKPGGRWYVFEHVKSPSGGLATRLYQRFVNIFWQFFLGGCLLCRDTGKNLRDAGRWSKVDLHQMPDEPAFQVVPHIMGTLTK